MTDEISSERLFQILGPAVANTSMPNLNAVVAISKGMWAVKMLQQNPPVLTQENFYNSCKMVAAVTMLLLKFVKSALQ